MGRHLNAANPPHILFYISGHGFGHARRTAQVIASLLTHYPAIRISARTSAPASIFTAVGLPGDRIASSSIDTGVVEDNALTIDPQRTLERIAALLAMREQTIAAELAAVGDAGVTLIATDIPFLAGDVAHALGVPCVAMGNFTWDWIYAPYFAEHPHGGEMRESIRRSYALMTAVLRQGFAHPMDQFPRVVDVPLVVTRSRLEPADALRRLGLDSRDARPRVLLGMRGGTSLAALVAGVLGSPHFLFVTVQPLPPDSPPNVRQVSLDGLDFADLLSVCDVIISKLGYGIVADSIAADTRLVWPRRTGFREDPLFEAEAPAYLRMREISREDYAAGRWEESLRAVMASPAPRVQPRMDGAEVCADFLRVLSSQLPLI